MCIRDSLVGIDAEVGVLIHHRDLGGGRALHAVQELHHVLDEGIVVGRGAEEPLVAALGQVRACLLYTSRNSHDPLRHDCDDKILEENDAAARHRPARGHTISIFNHSAHASLGITRKHAFTGPL